MNTTIETATKQVVRKALSLINDDTAYHNYIDSLQDRVDIDHVLLDDMLELYL